MTGMAALELRDVFRIHVANGQGAVALQGLTLTVRVGERCVVLGPSGSGKSTLLRIAAGFERPTAGVARTLGVDLGALSPRGAAAFRATHLGFLDQHYARSLSPALSCAENVGLALRLAGESPGAQRRRALELLARVGLEDRADNTPEALSGGEKQRVAACAALAHRPAILFADEPAGELDAATAATVYELLGELTAQDRATLVVVSHDERAADLADRVVHVRDGRLSAEATGGVPARLVVGRGGWVRLPAEARRGAGIEGHVGWRIREGEVGLTGDRSVVEPVAVAVAPPMAGEVVAELRGVGKGYGVGEGRREVLSGLDARFERGRLVALEGRSGSGKTTVLHLLAGLERPDAGVVRVAGRDLGALDREQLADHRRTRIGWVGQEPGLIPFATARENATLSLEIRDRGFRPEHAGEATAWLERLGLGDCLDRLADRLSAGERQRVAIARVLARGPAVLLLDEPTARLDEESAALVAGLLVVAARASNAAVICATHDRRVAAQADAVIAIERLQSRNPLTTPAASASP
jgi:ABC-type lipoprotein export system ATPase subunit